MQDKNIKIKPVPSKLFMYQKFYEDLQEMKEKYKNFSITEFACGASKILDSIKPTYYQGIDLKKKLILNSKHKNKNKNYNFFIGNMLNFKSKKQTSLGFCIQTFGINLDFNDFPATLKISFFNLSSTYKMHNFDFIINFQFFFPITCFWNNCAIMFNCNFFSY